MVLYEQFNQASDVSLSNVGGMIFDLSGEYLYMINNEYSIVRFDASGTQFSFFDELLSGNNGQFLVFDSIGNLYMSDYNKSKIYQINPSGSYITYADNNNLSSDASLNGPTGLVFDANGILYCANFGAYNGTGNNRNSIVQIDTSGVVTLFADGNAQGSDASFNGPQGLVFDANGILYCANYNSTGNNRNSIVQIDTSGVVTLFADNNLNSDASLNNPVGLVLDNSGNFYCTNFNSSAAASIVQIDASGTNISNFISSINSGVLAARGIAIKNNILYFNGTSASTSIASIVYRTDEPVCFNRDTKILCLNHLLEEEYIPIQDLKKGDFVKTYLHEFRRIDYIYQSFMRNNPNQWNRCMYKMEKTEENGLLEDLIVTGGHAIMVDSISEVEQERYNNIGLPNFAEENKIDDKYLLLSSVSEQFIPLTDNESYTIYHFCLENDGDDNARYGVWANGILTETPSKHYLVEENIWKC
jgi:sugar lactone lactonase YvrE